MSLGFEADIRPLFSDRDRYEMEFVFDLWSFDDVRAHATGILERLADGTMPCDEPWPGERVDRFRAWLEGGCLR